MRRSIFAVSALALVLGSGSALASGAHGAHWDYDGKEGPDHWGDISADFATCKTGKTQSPIDIKPSATKKGSLKPIEFHYEAATNPEVVNNGHTIQVVYPAGSYAILGGTKYNLLQFHFHIPSEEAIDGKRGDMDVHLVHKTDDGKLGVVGVLLNAGNENSVVKAVEAAMPAHEGKQNMAGTINAADLLPKDQAYWNFSGSLTTPPCSEGVNWNVMKNPVSISKAQIDAYKKLFPMTARPVQPLNNREVVSSN